MERNARGGGEISNPSLIQFHRSVSPSPELQGVNEILRLSIQLFPSPILYAEILRHSLGKAQGSLLSCFWLRQAFFKRKLQQGLDFYTQAIGDHSHKKAPILRALYPRSVDDQIDIQGILRILTSLHRTTTSQPGRLQRSSLARPCIFIRLLRLSQSKR